jgi:hypothetical protein
MKISCDCGEVIIDQADDLPYKAHLVPDQEWYANFDALDDQVIDLVADGRMDKQAAYRLSRLLLSQSSRLMWQCAECGRLYVEGPDEQVRCFAPESGPFERQILRRRPKSGS